MKTPGFLLDFFFFVELSAHRVLNFVVYLYLASPDIDAGCRLSTQEHFC